MSSGPPVYTPTDHTAAMNQLLPSEFQGLTNLGYFISALGAQLNDVDEFFGQLFTGLNLELAVGAQLDGLGTILSQSRNGLADEAYRTLLQARINAWQSEGATESIIQLLMALVAPQTVQLLELYPAKIQVSVVGEGTPAISDNDIVTACYQAKLAGVELDLQVAKELPAFQFDKPATANNAGLDQGHLAGPYS